MEYFPSFSKMGNETSTFNKMKEDTVNEQFKKVLFNISENTI